MTLLLNWRLWAALIVAGGLAFSHFTAYRKGKQNVRNEWTLAVAEANADARKLETLRQSRADEAARAAVGRAAVLRRDADRALDSARGLRGALDLANRAREESADAAAKRAAALGELLAQGAEAHRELAERCDRHVNDLRQLLDAWPR